MIQCAAVIVVAELIARFLPLPLRKKSSKNCYRFDGSLSESRRVRERRAHLRFRRDLWLLLAIALLVGNVLVSVCTSYGIPLQQLFEGNFAAATVNTIGALAGILIFCGVPLLFGLRWAIRNFSQGVERRRAEHEALDTSRMNISGSEFSAQLLSSQQSANQPVANQPVANQQRLINQWPIKLLRINLWAALISQLPPSVAWTLPKPTLTLKCNRIKPRR